jgi:hypothetical protein
MVALFCPALTQIAVPLQNDGTVSESISSRLAKISLPDADGKLMRLGALWAERPAVVVFLRHYG